MVEVEVEEDKCCSHALGSEKNLNFSLECAQR